MRILVTGPRYWWDDSLIRSALTDGQMFCKWELGLSGRPTLIAGGAGGLDTMALREALNRGWLPEIHHAKWEDDEGKRNKLAGFERNQEMVDGKPDVGLVFCMLCQKTNCRRTEPHFTHGTMDCLRRLNEAGIPVRKYYS